MGYALAMQVRLLFFGMLKEIAGHDSESLELPAGSRVSDLLANCASRSPRLKQYLPSVAVAVNEEYGQPGAELHDRDVVALIPPVSGGAGAVSAAAQRAWIVHRKIDTQTIVDSLKRPEDGAVAVFEGIVRNHSRGRRTLYLDYEAYESMAQKQLEALATEALSKFAVRDVRIVHRLGRLEIGETSVLIVVASAHRGAGFDACRWLIDTLKRTVPIWKKEYFEDGAVWADGEPFPENLATGRNLSDPPASK